MCGIVGWLGKNTKKRNIYTLTRESLCGLEYRGFDSCGIALISSAFTRTIKALDAPSTLPLDYASELKDEETVIALGHTRWATHGGICDENTHPIENDTAILVHNGIVENYEGYKDPNIEYKGSTDTEVALHYFTKLLSKYDPLEALTHLQKNLTGMYAFVFVIKSQPDTFYFVRKGVSSLYIGKKDNLVGICSDANVLSKEFKEVYRVSADSYGYVNLKELVTLPYEKEIQVKKLTNVVYSPENDFEITSLPDGETYMRLEIDQQPAVLAATLASLKKHILPELNFKKILFIGCGSAYNAGSIAAQWFIEQGIPAFAYIATEATTYLEQLTDHYRDTLFVFISQSGETLETIEVARMVKKRGLNSIGIINRPNSSLEHYVEHTIHTHAGREISVASTKAFTSQLMALGWLLYKHTENYEILRQLKMVPDLLEGIIPNNKVVYQLSETVKCPYILAKDIGLIIAKEISLKIKEIGYINVNAESSSEFKHGPLALVDSDFFALFIMPSTHSSYDRVQANVQEVIARDGKAIVLTDKYINIKNENLFVEILPSTSIFTAPFVYTKYGQELALAIGLLRGNNVDTPRNLVKSVTVI